MGIVAWWDRGDSKALADSRAAPIARSLYSTTLSYRNLMLCAPTSHNPPVSMDLIRRPAPVEATPSAVSPFDRSAVFPSASLVSFEMSRIPLPTLKHLKTRLTTLRNMCYTPSVMTPMEAVWGRPKGDEPDVEEEKESPLFDDSLSSNLILFLIWPVGPILLIIALVFLFA